MLQIVLVAFNNLNQVQHTIQSLELIRIPYEVLIVDSSTDSLVRNFCSQIQKFRVKYIWEEKNGIYHAMNTGWKNCQSTDLVWYLNPGDFLHSGESLEKLARGIETSGAVWGFAQAIPGGDQNSIFPPALAEITSMGLHKGILSISHQAILVQRKELQRLGGFNERYQIAADLDLEFKLLTSSTGYFEKSPLVDVDIHGLSHKKVVRTLYESAVVRRKNNILSSWGATTWFIAKISHKVFINMRNRIQ